MNTAGGRRGGGGEESEDEGYEIDEVRDSSKWSWKRPMKALRRELSGDGLGRDGLGREGAWSTGTRLERLVIHPDNCFLLKHETGGLGLRLESGGLGLGLPISAWWWLIRWLGLRWFGCLLISTWWFGLALDRPGVVAWAWAWVSVHGVVVVDGLGLGLGSPRGGWVFWVLPLGFRCTAWWWLTAWAWAWVHTVWWWLTAWAWAWVHGVVVGNGFGFLVVEPWVSAWRWWSRAGSGCFEDRECVDRNGVKNRVDEICYSVAMKLEVDSQIFPGFGTSLTPKRWYVAWTHFILLWAVYSSFFTPLEFGFFRGLPENLFLLDIAGQFAFLIDIVVRFFVAYRDTHSYRIVHDRNLIAIRYVKSRFFVDILGCLPWDAIYKASGRKEVVRYLLWIRLSRALRVTEFFEKLEKDIRINYLATRIVKLFVVELYCTHTAACIFYYLATTVPKSNEGHTWIGSLKMGDYSYSHFREIDLWKRYVTSLYFAIVTMATVGYGEIHAVNVREMIFIMIYVSFDMILGAYLLGNMAALIVKGSKTEKFRDKMADIIKYMNKSKLDRHITKQIKGHLRLQYERHNTEVDLLQDIPASIRTKVNGRMKIFFLETLLIFSCWKAARTFGN
uniref:Ion transport domain-containing protein n=1 Tax=Fagus sylvatica TaxID=28930 RepID=A0A2N9EF47_FAGSY